MSNKPTPPTPGELRMGQKIIELTKDKQEFESTLRKLQESKKGLSDEVREFKISHEYQNDRFITFALGKIGAN